MELVEKKDDMSFVIKANGLKRKSEESTKEMEALEKQITELENKKKSPSSFWTLYGTSVIPNPNF